MPASTTLFEGLDLLDLWHVYGSISIVSTLRNTTPSKISRQTSSFLNELGLDKIEDLSYICGLIGFF